jgi:hypothetical protein
MRGLAQKLKEFVVLFFFVPCQRHLLVTTFNDDSGSLFPHPVEKFEARP